MTLQGTRHPFTKLKPGMRAVFQTSSGPSQEGCILSKHNGSQSLTILGIGGTTYEGVPYAEYQGTPRTDPLDQIHPMLAKDISKRKTLSLEEVIQSTEWFLEEKYDGERQILTFIPDRRQAVTEEYVYSQRRHGGFLFRATTRVVGKNTGRLSCNSRTLAHVAEQMTLSLLGTTVLDVEVMHADGFQRLRSIMGSLPEKAIQLQEEYGPVFVVVFDALWWNGIDLRDKPFWERRAILENWFGDSIVHKYRILSPLARTEEEKRSLLGQIQEDGGEGAMMKFVCGEYTDTSRSGRRSSEVLKIKPFLEDDVIIYGFEQGKGEYNQHKLGAIRFAQWVPAHLVTAEMQKGVLASATYPDIYGPDLHDLLLVHMGTCSGITDEQEAAFRADPESFFGRVMEIRFQARWSATGLCRHPSFVRMRSDKNPEQCVYGRDA